MTPASPPTPATAAASSRIQAGVSLDSTSRNRAFDCMHRRGLPTHGYGIYTASDARPSYQRRAMEAVQQEAAASRDGK